MAKKRNQKNKPEPVVTRDIPYIRCFAESGMIETVSGIYTKCYEILPPKRQKELTYSAKRVRECLKGIFLLFQEMSFRVRIFDAGKGFGRSPTGPKR